MKMRRESLGFAGRRGREGRVRRGFLPIRHPPLPHPKTSGVRDG